MVRKSYGKMRGSRHKLTVKKKPTITRFLQEFKQGDIVHIDLVPSSKLPHPRFQHITGTVCEKRGRSYGVKIRVGNAYKTLYLKPEHLKQQK